MNAPQCQPGDHINLLAASPRAVGGTGAARAQPAQDAPPAHDACARQLHRPAPDPATLRAGAEPQLRRGAGVLALGDSTPDKPYARKIGLLTRHWSGKHRRVVRGSNLPTLLWTGGEALVPRDDRLCEQGADGPSKDGHRRARPDTAEARGLAPERVVFDSWYAGLANLKVLLRRAVLWYPRRSLAVGRWELGWPAVSGRARGVGRWRRGRTAAIAGGSSASAAAAAGVASPP